MIASITNYDTNNKKGSQGPPTRKIARRRV